MSRLFPGGWRKGSGHRAHPVLSLTFGYGKSPWKLQLQCSSLTFPMRSLLFLLSLSFFIFFFLTAESISVLGSLCSKWVAFNSEFSWVTFGSQARDLLCSSHLLSLPPAPGLVTLGALQNTWAHHSFHTKLPFQRKSRLGLLLVNLSFSVECGKVRSACRADGKMFKRKGVWHGTGEINNEEGRF